MQGEGMMQFMPPGMPPPMGMPPQGPMGGMRAPLLGAAPPGFMQQRQMGPGPPNRFGPPGKYVIQFQISTCWLLSIKIS